MFRNGDGFKKVILCCGYVDLRRGIDGLSAYIKLNYNLDPLEKGTLFLFCGRRNDRIKGLCFEGIGMTLYYMRLSGGNTFRWPRNSDEAKAITAQQYNMLMSGFAVEGTIKEIYPHVTPEQSQNLVTHST